MKIFLQMTALLLSSSVLLNAACEPKNVIFSCMTNKGKTIEVCDNKTEIVYSFGKSATKPEITIVKKRNEVTTSQWNGMGSSMYYDVSIPNNTTIYKVYFSVDRMSDRHKIDAGVNVTLNDKSIANVMCQEKGLINNLEGVDLPLEQ